MIIKWIVFQDEEWFYLRDKYMWENKWDLDYAEVYTKNEVSQILSIFQDFKIKPKNMYKAEHDTELHKTRIISEKIDVEKFIITINEKLLSLFE